MAFAGAEIQRGGLASGGEVIESQDVCFRKVVHMDVVANAGAILGGIIRAINVSDQGAGLPLPAACRESSAVSGSWSSPISPLGSAPAALK